MAQPTNPTEELDLRLTRPAGVIKLNDEAPRCRVPLAWRRCLAARSGH
jgi:hypothetical protein